MLTTKELEQKKIYKFMIEELPDVQIVIICINPNDKTRCLSCSNNVNTEELIEMCQTCVISKIENTLNVNGIRN